MKLKILSLLCLVIFSLSAESEKAHLKERLSWKNSRTPFALYLDPFLPMNLDDTAKSHPLLDALHKHGFTFFHHDMGEEIPDELRKLCPNKKRLTLFYFDGSRRKLIDLNSLDSPKEFEKIISKYRTDNDKRRQSVLLRKVRQLVKTMSQSLKEKNVSGSQSGQASVFEGRDISDKEYAACRKQLVEIEALESLGLEKILKQLDDQRQRYKEEFAIKAAKTKKRPGITSNNNKRQHLTYKQITKLVNILLNDKDSIKRLKAENLLKYCHPHNHNELYKVLQKAKHNHLPDHSKTPRRQAITLSFNPDNIQFGEIIVQLPEKYTGEKPLPLVIRFHGSEEDVEICADQWQKLKHAEKMISVSPTLSFSEKVEWNNENLEAFYLAIYNYMCHHYNIKIDQVYLSGFSTGAVAAGHLAQQFSQQIAGFFVKSDFQWIDPRHPSDCQGLLSHIPGVYLVGTDDSLNRNNRLKEVRNLIRKNKYAKSYFHFVPKLDHKAYHKLDNHSFNYLSNQKRVVQPKFFNAYFFEDKNTKKKKTSHYWMTATDFDKKGTRCTLTIKDHKILIEAKGLRAAELYLNDSLIPLDQTIIVLINGKIAHYNKVPRSSEFLINHFLEHRDPKRLFWNKIKIKVYD